MQFYSPYQRNGQQDGSPPLVPMDASQQAATPVPMPLKQPGYTPPPGYNGPKVQGDSEAGRPLNAKDRFGTITMGGLADPAWGTGITFQQNAKIEGIRALKNAMSTANPEDYAAMDELRNYYRGALSDLPSTQNAMRSSFDTQSQRGLSNLMSNFKNANAGRGTLGSRQYGGAAGDILSRANSDYVNGLIANRMAGLDAAGKISSGLTGVQNRDLLERQFQMDQAKGYSGQINNQQALEGQREGALRDLEAQQEADDRGLVGNLVGAYMSMLGFGAGAGAAVK